jgi:serine/threonine protein kinase
MSASTRCPNESQYRRFLAGQLVDREARSLREHLGTCMKCRTLFENLETETGTPPADKADQGDTAPVDPGTIAQTPEDGTIGDEATLDLSFLHPSKQQQSLGRIGEYEVLSVLGEGGMGIVFKGFDESLRRFVAIKVLAPHLASSQKARLRFIREARAAAGINHPNVVTIHAVNNKGELPFLVMEYIAGSSLRHRIRVGPDLEPGEVFRIAAQIAKGLAAAHEHGVIHRDIKPANIMLEDGVERVKITDFGLAVAAMNVSGITSQGQLVGTPAYMSPEQINAQPVDSRSDLFSLGCVMYAMVAGHSPFQGTHTLEVIRKVCDHDPPPLHELEPTIPRTLSDLVAWLLEKKPEDRPQSSTEFAALLTQHLASANGRSSDSMRDLPNTRLPVRGQRHRLEWKTVLALALMAMMVVTLAWVLRPSKKFAMNPFVAPSPQPIVRLGLVTVAKTGEARAGTIGQALEMIRPGGTIRVLDDATYEEQILIDDPQRWRGLILEAKGQATLVATGREPALTIRSTPGVIVRGFRFRTDSAHGGIVVEGTTAGTQLVNLDCVQGPHAFDPLIRIKAESNDPGLPAVTLRGSRIEGSPPTVCVWVERGQGSLEATGGVRLEDNLFCGPTVHLLFWGPVHDVHVTGNRFHESKNAINVNFKNPGEARRVRIANNTFHKTVYWLGLVYTDPREQEITVANNLILGGRKIEWSRPEQIDEIAANWSFLANWWETVPESDDPVALHRGLVVARTDVDLKSRDLKSPEYLHPPEGSPLATAGAGGDLPRYIGAFAPAEPKPK